MPDVFVVFGNVEVPQSSYRVWETGVVPQFVMQVASKSKHLKDRDKKAGTYEGMGVLEYWRFDPTAELFREPEYGERVLWQRLGPSGRYEPIELGPEGWARSEVLELDVCEVEGRLRFWDYMRKRFLSSHTESEEEKQEERRLRADAERKATEAEQAYRSAEAEIARLRALLVAAKGEEDPSDHGG